jgi:hypothetical protein
VAVAACQLVARFVRSCGFCACLQGRIALAASTHDPRQPSMRPGGVARVVTRIGTEQRNMEARRPAWQSVEGTRCSTHNPRRQLTPPSVPATKGKKDVGFSIRRRPSDGSTITVVGRFHWPDCFGRLRGLCVNLVQSSRHPQAPHGQYRTAVSSITFWIRAVWTNVTL